MDARQEGDAIVCFAPPPKPVRGRGAREKSCTVEVVYQTQKLAVATFDYTAVPFWRWAVTQTLA